MGFYLVKLPETNFWLNKRNQKGFKGKCQELICWVAKYSTWHIFTKSTHLIIVNCGVLLNVFPIQYILFFYRAFAFPLLKVCQALPLHLFSIGLITCIIFTKKAKHSLATIYIQQARTGKTHKHKKLVFLFLLWQLTINARNPSIEIAACWK